MAVVALGGVSDTLNVCVTIRVSRLHLGRLFSHVPTSRAGSLDLLLQLLGPDGGVDLVPKIN